MEDVMTITPLGSGQEVGRSCHLLEFRGMTIMLDCGIHPGYEGMNGLPFLDQVEPDQIDVLLITHFHLDHAASLPYLTERTSFRGRIFMTHPTKAVLRLLLGDYIRLLQMKNAKPEDVLYTESELQACVDKLELIDYHTTVTVGGLSFHALNAGHVLGACMFWLDIGGRTVLYTGDYSMEDDRHLMAAELPGKKPDVLMVEATYGVQVHASRAEREARFTGTIERIVTRGGRCLIPVFALGRAQELLLILDEYWQANPHLQNIPIWYASKLASRALRVYQTYANMMNARIRAQMDVSNPFSFKYIQNLKSIDVNNFNDSVPSVVFASPGMLQSGVSRQLFDRWAPDPKNGVMIAGYAVEHTMAKEIMNQPKEVVTLEGRRQPLNCLVDYVSFSAHVDFVQNRSFITQVDPKHIILVHGQKDEMGRLKSALLLQYRQLAENKRPTITMPPNLQTVSLKFARRRSAKVMGTLAMREAEPFEGEKVHGILVTHNFHSKIVQPEDLATYTPLRVGSVHSKLHVPYSGSVYTLRLFLSEMFAGISESEIPSENDADGDSPCVKFSLNEDRIKILLGKTEGVAIVEWEASPASDVIADAVVALLMHAQSSAASIRLTSKPCCRPRDDSNNDGNENSTGPDTDTGAGTGTGDANNNDDEGGDEKPPASKRARHVDEEGNVIESRLRLMKSTLEQQFSTVEATYEGPTGTFEITTDSGLESGTLNEDGVLVCTAKVEFFDSTGADAKITMECQDKKFASNVHECLRNLAATLTPLTV